MTDKEKLEKVRAEIERLYNQSLTDENRQAELGLKSAACTSYGKSKVCKELLSFIDSMQEEPVSNPIDFEKELYKAFGQVKDFTLGMRIAKWFYDMGKNSQEPVSEDLDLGCGVIWKGEEPVSEELEEAANEYAKDYLFTPKPQRAPNIHFINGANWQKQQMMAKAVDVTIAIPYQNGYGGYTQLVDSKEGLPFGDNIKVLVIKED